MRIEEIFHNQLSGTTEVNTSHCLPSDPHCCSRASPSWLDRFRAAPCLHMRSSRPSSRE